MKATFKTRPERGVGASRVAMALMPLALFVAGCSGTLQTRSASADDTYYRWKPQMETLPIEVHGGTQQFGPDDMAEQIPYGTTPREYAGSTDGQKKLAAIPRIVLYVGSGQHPASDAYCDAYQAMQPLTAWDAKTRVVAALCDGPRLIDVTTRNVQRARIENEGMRSIVKSMKQRLLFGLKADDQVVAAEYGNE